MPVLTRNAKKAQEKSLIRKMEKYNAQLEYESYYNERRRCKNCFCRVLLPFFINIIMLAFIWINFIKFMNKNLIKN